MRNRKYKQKRSALALLTFYDWTNLSW